MGGGREQGCRNRVFPVVFLLVGESERVPDPNWSSELHWPQTVLICVGEKLWCVILRSSPSSAPGAHWLPSGLCKTSGLLFS